MDLKERTKRRLDETSAASRFRTLAEPRGIDLSSNDYLLLSRDSRIKDSLIRGVRRDGCGSTASRLLRGHREVFGDAEKCFARFKGVERSLFFATGYQANIGVLDTFLEKEDLVFSDALNHASLIDGVRVAKAKKVIFAHRDTADLRRKIRRHRCSGQRFLMTESLFSMDGDVAPLDEYAAICDSEGINLFVDEAHAVGLYGNRGSGLIEEFGIGESVAVSINTCGKALGVSGAFVAGDGPTIEYLVQKCRSFIYSTAPLPGIADALICAIGIIESDGGGRKRILELSGLLSDLLRSRGIEVPERPTQIYPIVVGGSAKAVRIANELQSKGFDVRAIRPPTVPEGTARLRIAVNSGLDAELLTRFVERLGTALSSASAAAP